MSYSYFLYQMQITDSEIDRINKRINEINCIINDQTIIKDAEKEKEHKQQSRKTAQLKLNKAEDKVQAQRIKIEQTETTLYSGKVKKPKELQSLQQEIESLKRFLSVLEDRLLEAMILYEEADDAHKKSNNKLQKLIQEKENQDKDLLKERVKLLQELEELINNRQKQTEKLLPEHIKLYEEIRRKKHGVAVSKIENKACGACGSTLTAALFQEAKSPSKLVQCPTCKRILYYPD